MKLLLINPPQHHTISGNLPTYVDEARGNIPPLGLLYTAAAVKKNTDWQVEICDMSAGDKLEREKPDLVGITATTFTIIDVLEVASVVKLIWNVPVVLGGIHPTIFPDETTSLPNIDCAFVGESEVTFPETIEYIAARAVRIVDGKQPDIELLPLPARELIKQDKYYSFIGKNTMLTSMFTSRGCPYQCIFCHRETMGKKFRARSAENILREISYLASQGIREILIYDDTFTVDKQRVLDICKGIITEKVANKMPDITFDIRARVNHVDENLLYYLAEAGCNRIHYGVEASNNKVLEVLKKGITVEQVTSAFKMTKRAGIETLAYFIIGSPTESQADIERTIEFAKELEPDYCHFSIMTPYPATPLYQQYLDSGGNDYWREFAQSPNPSFKVPYYQGLSRETLEELIGRAYKEFYLRPKRVVKELVKTKSFRQFSKKSTSAIKMLVRR